MSRKNIIYDHKALVSGDMSTASLTGSVTTVAQHDVVTYDVIWSGGQATNGDITIKYSRDGLNFYDLNFGAVISCNGASGSHQVIVNEIGFKFLVPVFTQTNGSATGTLDIHLFATNKGA